MMGNKKIFVSLGMILLLVIVTIGVTFAAFTFTKEGTVENTIETSTIMLTYTEGKTGITLNEAYPISDEKGKMLTGENNVFDFTVTATLGKSNVISYEVTAVKIPITDMTPLEDNEVKLYLERAVNPDTAYQEVLAPSNFVPIESQSEVGSSIGSMILDSGIFMEEGTTIHNYRLRLWVDESAEIPNGEARKYGVKVNVYAKQLSSDNFTDEACFTFDSTTGTITGYSDECSADVVIPYTIDGVKVTSIGDNVFNARTTKLTSVVLPNTITSIGEAAFRSNRLTSLSIPNSVKSIGDFAFISNRLTEVVIPDGVTTIGASAFSKNKITNLVIPNSVTSIAKSAFNFNQLSDEDAFIYQRNEDGSIDYTTIIGYGGAKQDDVIIPNNVTHIGEYTFRYNQLTSVTIPNSVTTIGGSAFDSNQLTNVTIPSSVTTIQAGAFSSNQLTSIILSDGLIDIGSGAFSSNQLTSVIIPKTVNNIRTSAFAKNSTLTKLVNKTGKEFLWKEILDVNTTSDFTCITCTFDFGSRTVEITSS